MTEETQTETSRSNLQKIIWFAFLALIFSLAIGTPFVYYQNQRIPLTDFLFLIVSLLFLLSIIFKTNKFRWHKFYWLLLFYFAAMLLSSIFSINPKPSFIKLLGEIYLLGLAVLTFNLVQTKNHFKQAILAWLYGTSVAIFVGLFTICLFYFQPQSQILQYTTSIYGAVPVGNYPRVTSTFISASMFCNYLNVSLILLFIAEHLKFVGKKLFWILTLLLLVCALFTISSGLGGIVLAVGVWLWLHFKDSKRVFAKLSLAGGIAVAVLFLAIIFFALQKYPNPPYSIKLPFSEIELLPSSRLLVWGGSLQTFSDNLLTGNGLDQDSCYVIFQNTDGSPSHLTDAHNIFLSVATQNGVLGLIAIVLIIYFFVRKFSYSTFNTSDAVFLKNALVLAFICAFFYQGLTGSFEDTRHLWVLIGFILSAETLEKTET